MKDTITPALDSKVPTTTAEEDRKTKGQRDINLIWERTQAIVAVLITGAMIYTQIRGIDAQALNTAFTSIIILYFVRTNHTKVGGISGSQDR